MSKDIRLMIDKINSLKRSLNENTTIYPPIPQPLYHGQPAKYDHKGSVIKPEKFTQFDQSKKRFLGDDNYGIYFTPNKREAYQYAEGGNVYVCQVKINNPYYYEHLFSYNNKGLIKSATFITKEDKQKLIDHGYDGVAFLDNIDRIGEVIALDPNQIKILEII
jgi:hypothetical protein